MDSKDLNDFHAILEMLRYTKEMWDHADNEARFAWLEWCEWRVREVKRRIG